MSLTTLGLELPTDPRWVEIARMHIGDILVDHAYCEQKAATSCISLIVHYPQKTLLVDTLTPVVAEEWEHFRRVLAELKKRGLVLGPQRRDLYVTELQKILRTKGPEEESFLDRLLFCALVEARSCERFKVLSQEISDENLSAFYHELMISEAGHYHTFIRLSEEYIPKAIVWARWKELLHGEAAIMERMEIRGDRIH